MNLKNEQIVKKIRKWYYSQWFLILLFLLWPLILPPILSIILSYKKTKLINILANQSLEIIDFEEKLKDLDNQVQNKELLVQQAIFEAKQEADNKIQDLNIEIQNLEATIHRKESLIQSIILEAEEKATKEIQDLINEQIKQSEQLIAINNQVEEATLTSERINKQINTQQNKLIKIKKLYNSIEYSINNFELLSEESSIELDELIPTTILKIHSMDIKSLRKAFKDNEKAINNLLNSYADRYTTKANSTLYKLMVLALSAELQNTLFNLRYTNLDKSLESIKLITKKYLTIATDGNQTIAPTMVRFIGELEYLYLNAIKIEYEYYTNKEKQKAEQAAIKEQMRQEAEERKQLEQQKKHLEKEESKYILEIDKAKEQLINENNEEMILQLNKKIEELQQQLQQVEVQKDEIINLQNGKAGNVYVISNIGSFGENVFKIGMTRRLDPLDRIKELSSASVPFSFDIHSFIFSDDAVGLEKKIHTILQDNRLNKINLRKEFFNISIDELEKIVTEIDPTAEFNKTILAEEYRQSLSIRSHAN